MRVWDVRRAIQAVRSLDGLKDAPLRLEAAGQAAGLVVYASLYEPGLDELVLHQLPATHRDGPILLNVRRFLDMPEAVAMAMERTPIRFSDSAEASRYASAVAENLGW